MKKINPVPRKISQTWIISSCSWKEETGGFLLFLHSRDEQIYPLEVQNVTSGLGICSFWWADSNYLGRAAGSTKQAAFLGNFFLKSTLESGPCLRTASAVPSHKPGSEEAQEFSGARAAAVAPQGRASISEACQWSRLFGFPFQQHWQSRLDNLLHTLKIWFLNKSELPLLLADKSVALQKSLLRFLAGNQSTCRPGWWQPCWQWWSDYKWQRTLHFSVLLQGSESDLECQSQWYLWLRGH